MNWSPEIWYSIGTAAAALLVSAAHTRGIRLPIVEKVLDVLHGTQPSSPNTPAAPPNATAQPVTLANVLDELRKRVPLPEESKAAPH